MRNFTVHVLSLFAISSLIVDYACYAFNKCCPPGEVFTGKKVICAPTPANAVELFFVNDNEGNSGYPVCEKPEHIATTPLDWLNSTSFVQVLKIRCKISFQLSRFYDFFSSLFFFLVFTEHVLYRNSSRTIHTSERTDTRAL